MHKAYEVITNRIIGLLEEGTVPWRRCFMARTAAVIDPCGNIVPCCFFDNYSVGNVRNGDLDRSWETPGRVRFGAYRDGGKLDVCRHCIVSVSRNRSARDIFRRAYIEQIRDPVQQLWKQASP